jgi:hypothetical protein
LLEEAAAEPFWASKSPKSKEAKLSKSETKKKKKNGNKFQQLQVPIEKLNC